MEFAVECQHFPFYSPFLLQTRMYFSIQFPKLSTFFIDGVGKSFEINRNIPTGMQLQVQSLFSRFYIGRISFLSFFCHRNLCSRERYNDHLFKSGIGISQSLLRCSIILSHNCCFFSSFYPVAFFMTIVTSPEISDAFEATIIHSIIFTHD